MMINLMVNSKQKGLKSCLMIGLAMLFQAFSLLAAQIDNESTIMLPSCDIVVTADEIYTHENGITYSGNVKVLIGFAHLKIDKVTLIKKENGQCALVPEFSFNLDHSMISANLYS
ncbi:hypothetical protein [Aliikangiella maris]|uniref:Uncharacterized protein n=2 Tax=Aliikangiella maris TaxID=3162458 RepID=A0ABV3MJC9_9GAMM